MFKYQGMDLKRFRDTFAQLIEEDGREIEFEAVALYLSFFKIYTHKKKNPHKFVSKYP